MKLGNISQSIVPIPNFFLDSTKEVDAFKIYYKTKKSKNNNKTNRNFSYYSKIDLLNSNLDININHNPRLKNDKFTLINKEKYLPIYKKFKTPNNTCKEISFPDLSLKTSRIITGKKNPFQNYFNLKKEANIKEKINLDIRNDILNNTYNLIERINSDYDLTKYTNFDSRTTMNRHFQTGYPRLTDSLKTTGSKKDLFRKVLKEKMHSLKTINSKTKEIIKRNNSYGDILYSYMDKSGINKNPENIKNNIDTLLDDCKSNLLKLKYNNQEPFKYNKKDKKFILDNKYLTSRINKTFLYKDFPSKTRMEFNMKKIVIPKKLMKYFGKSIYISKEKYDIDKFDLNNNKIDMWKRPLHHDAYKFPE